MEFIHDKFNQNGLLGSLYSIENHPKDDFAERNFRIKEIDLNVKNDSMSY
jgi:hypothetical protein